MSTELEIPEPLADILLSCEVICISGCCGIDAFDIAPQWIRVWLESHDAALLVTAQQQIDEIIENLAETQGDYGSALLNHGGSANSWVALLKEWKEAIEKAPSTPLPKPPQAQSPAQIFRENVHHGLILFGCAVLGAAPLAAVFDLIYWLLKRWW